MKNFQSALGRRTLAAALAAAMLAAGSWTVASAGVESTAAKKVVQETSPSASSEIEERPEYAVKVLKLVNKEREKAGIPALAADDALDAVARLRAKECVEICDANHTRPDGRDYVTAFDDAKIPYVYWGENTYYGQNSVQTPEKVVKGWMNSPGHKANILNEHYTAAGVGKHVVGDEYYWALDFIGTK